MSVRKSLGRSAFHNLRSVCFTSIRLFLDSVSAIVGAKKKKNQKENDSGVQLPSTRLAGDGLHRGGIVAHAGYLGLEAVWAHVQTSSSPAKKAKFTITHETRVWFRWCLHTLGYSV